MAAAGWGAVNENGIAFGTTYAIFLLESVSAVEKLADGPGHNATWKCLFLC